MRLFFALTVMLLPAHAWAQVPENLEALGERSLALVNQARSAEGLRPLELEYELTEAALAHARDMLARNYFAHTAPGGGTVLDRYRDAGGHVSRVVRENLSRCQGCRSQPDLSAVEDMHEGWMASPGHRANILAEGLTDFGFAVVQDSQGNRYGVQTFAGPGAPRGEVPDGPVTAMGPEAQTRLAAGIINGLRSGAAPVEPDERLRRHIEARLPAEGLARVTLSTIDLLSGLPADFPWLNYQVLYGECGGCGAEPTNSDVHFFLDSWTDKRRSRAILKGGSLTSIGFVIVADGQGRKIAALLLAGE
ncbi:MAG: CAP domain-containing protein [Hoeflea sp.]|uniref:CAP domain-containing protein n=1 Tax=Hoeflea sp. TaxID=1940281 RepID=UPI00272F74D1|nr:CAP domain-containing protein [Hoeflea sp.]MDP2118837.1 CAP domain-containing protein [Hoeflea sp.]